MEYKPEAWQEIYEKLSAPMPEEAVEGSKGAVTGKGYDTSGYRYQYCVNRFNEVLSILGWTFSYEEIDRLDGTDKSGRPRISVTMDCTIEICEGMKRTCSGGHISNNYADARKGAITNAFKKTAALFGVGKAAYEGSIDDDNKPMTDGGSYEVVRPQNAPRSTQAPDVMTSSPEQIAPRTTDYAAHFEAQAPVSSRSCEGCKKPFTPKLGYEKLCYPCYKRAAPSKAEAHMEKVEDQAMKYGEPNVPPPQEEYPWEGKI